MPRRRGAPFEFRNATDAPPKPPRRFTASPVHAELTNRDAVDAPESLPDRLIESDHAAGKRGRKQGRHPTGSS